MARRGRAASRPPLSPTAICLEARTNQSTRCALWAAIRTATPAADTEPRVVWREKPRAGRRHPPCQLQSSRPVCSAHATRFEAAARARRAGRGGVREYEWLAHVPGLWAASPPQMRSSCWTRSSCTLLRPGLLRDVLEPRARSRGVRTGEKRRTGRRHTPCLPVHSAHSLRIQYTRRYSAQTTRCAIHSVLCAALFTFDATLRHSNPSDGRRRAWVVSPVSGLQRGHAARGVVMCGCCCFWCALLVGSGVLSVCE